MTKTSITTLTKRDRETIMLAIGIAIEHENRALELCRAELHSGSFPVGEAILERQRTLTDLHGLRRRLLASPEIPRKKPAAPELELLTP